MTIKTFRGLIANNDQDTIVLHTNDGSIGYRIVKFQVMGIDANSNLEQVVKIYKIAQTEYTTSIDFSDNTLLATAVFNDKNDVHYQPPPIIIFDTEIFNQDIYVTNRGHDSTGPMNYYLELEQVKLDLSENTVATLKDIRNITQPK